jgi:hypothetical protein
VFVVPAYSWFRCETFPQSTDALLATQKSGIRAALTILTRIPESTKEWKTEELRYSFPVCVDRANLAVCGFNADGALPFQCTLLCILNRGFLAGMLAIRICCSVHVIAHLREMRARYWGAGCFWRCCHLHSPLRRWQRHCALVIHRYILRTQELRILQQALHRIFERLIFGGLERVVLTTPAEC